MSDQKPEQKPAEDDANTIDGADQRQQLREIRKAAGWRVAPRHVDVAVQALEEVGETLDVERIADIASKFHGDGSRRQKRNPDLWRLLGAQLAVRGKPADPEAQLRFIGRAKAVADEDVSDSDLLLVATALGSANHPLTPEVTGNVAAWIVDLLGSDFDPDALDDRLDRAVEAALEERARHANRRRRGGNT